MSNLIGKEIGGYRILTQIGVGGMAKVYKAYQPKMDRVVALKVLPDHYSKDETFLKRFDQEARIIANLENRNILSVFDYGQDNGVAFLAMRYLRGGTLKDVMSNAGDRQLSLTDAAHVIDQIGNALDYSHEQGIVHRDLKPSNILVDENGDCYLTDFGIAKVLDATSHLTSAGSTLGTPAYMSPEQASGKGVDHRSDIYSLGIILYELAVGKVPFDTETPYATVLAHINAPIPLPRELNPELPERIERVVLKALAKNVEDRYQSAGEMVGALFEALEAENIHVGGGDKLEVSNTLLQVSSKLAQTRPNNDMTIDDIALAKKQRRKEMIRKFAPLGMILIIIGLLAVIGVMALWPEQQAGLEPTLEFTQTVETGIQSVSSTDAYRPSQQEIENALFFDDFDDPAYDGSYNPNLWQEWEHAPLQSGTGQENGVFHFAVPASEEEFSMGLYDEKRWGTDQLKYIEVRFNINAYDGWGIASLYFMLEPYGSPGRDIHISTHTDNLFHGAVTTDSSLEANSQIKPDTWYTARIEIDPDTFTVSYYLNGDLVDSITSSQAEEWKKTELSFGFFGEVRGTTELFYADIDYVLVGGVDGESLAVAPDPTIMVAPELSSTDAYRPSEQEIANALFFDDFDDPEYDGSFNPEKWEEGDDYLLFGANGNQKNGSFHYDIPAYENEIFIDVFQHLQDNQWTIDELKYYEARFKISPYEGEGDACVNFDLNVAEEGAGDWQIFFMPCGGRNQYEVGLNTGGDWRNHSGFIESDTWYTFRIEIEPESFTVSYYLNGELLVSFVPSRTERWKSAPLFFNFAAHVNGTTEVFEVDIDYILVGGADGLSFRPSEEELEKALFFDDFNNPTYDGSYNPALWNTGDTLLLGGTGQKNGFFHFEIPVREDDIWFGLGNDNQYWTVEKLKYLEARFKIGSYDGFGDSCVNYGLYPFGASEDWAIHFEACGGRNMYWGRVNTVEEWYETMGPLEPNTWYTFRIEIEPETFAVAYYLNGKLLDTFVPSQVEKWKTAPLIFNFAAHVNGSTEVLEVDIDYILIGGH